MHRWVAAAFISLVLAAGVVVVVGVGAPTRGAQTAPSVAIPSPPASVIAPRPEDTPDRGPEPEGSAKPGRPLPDGAPTSVQVGVVQFSYRGAERAPAGAPSKSIALERARAALTTALTDFPAAVKLGDPGSGADLGRLPRGVLEPDLEYAIFTLEVGAIYPEPLDTPRGYWLVRRNR